jgi:hypothetical protein
VIVDGKFIIKAGIVRRRLGRPGAEPQQIEQARQLLAQASASSTLYKLGTSTVQNLKREMLAA